MVWVKTLWELWSFWGENFLLGLYCRAASSGGSNSVNCQVGSLFMKIHQEIKLYNKLVHLTFHAQFVNDKKKVQGRTDRRNSTGCEQWSVFNKSIQRANKSHPILWEYKKKSLFRKEIKNVNMPRFSTRVHVILLVQQIPHNAYRGFS